MTGKLKSYQYNQPFTRQGIAKLVKKYLTAAGIKKPASVHLPGRRFCAIFSARTKARVRAISWTPFYR